MCGPKGDDISAVLVRNRLQILAILVFLHSNLELGFFLEEATYR